MFCVIQEITNKRPDPNGWHKELLLDETLEHFEGRIRKKYGYKLSSERFERPNRTAYKIAVHQSYREGEHIRKRQWAICTIGYYELLTSSPKEQVDKQHLKAKLKEIGITENRLWELVDAKLAPIVQAIKLEFEASEEFKTQQEHKRLIRAWRIRRKLFEKSNGVDAYEFCYDFFNESMDLKFEHELSKAFRERKEEEERKRRAEERERSYWEHFKRESSNYNGNYGFPPIDKPSSRFSEAEQALLKKFYRVLARSFHPDLPGGSEEAMKLVNTLKEDWGI